VIAGAVLAIVGAVGTWIHVTDDFGHTFNGSGTSNGRDGSIVIGLAVVALAIAVLRAASRRIPRWLGWVTLALALALIATCAADIADVHNKVHDARVLTPSISGGPGWGLWLDLIASIVVLAGAAASIDLRRSQTM
jgi:hypothetical protein